MAPRSAPDVSFGSSAHSLNDHQMKVYLIKMGGSCAMIFLETVGVMLL